MSEFFKGAGGGIDLPHVSFLRASEACFKDGGVDDDDIRAKD